MNDRWKRSDRERWNDPTQIRIARRFRHHVRTLSNPKGRIHREICFNVAQCGCYGPAEAHHVDYERPFHVLWVCIACHRKVDHGGLKFKKSDLWDYSSLVLQKPALQVENRLAKEEPPEAPIGKYTPVEDIPPF